MTDGIDLPAWVAILTAALVLTGATLTLVGSIGLLNLPDFYQRLHAPTLGTTLGTGTILPASLTYFSVLDTDRTRVVQGERVSVRVDIGGRRINQKKHI